MSNLINATSSPVVGSESDRTSPARSPSRFRIAIYTAAVLGLGWLGPLIDQAIANGAEAGTGSGVEASSSSGPGQLLWLLLPIGAATLLRWKGGDGFADAGLRPRYRQNRRWYEVSSAFYPVVMLIAAAGGLVANQWALHDNWSPWRFAALAAVALVPFTVAAIAEEFGWRGYLTARLDAAGVGRLTNHLIVGVVWGAWHLPYMSLFWDFTDESLWTLAPRVILGTTAVSVVYGEIRLRTGSVWPAVVMHASSNAVATALLNTDQVLTINEPRPWIFSPGVDGLVVLALSAVAGLALLVKQPTQSTAHS